MASTKSINTIGDRKAKTVLVNQIEHLEQQLQQRLKQYKTQNNEEFPIKLERVDEEAEQAKYEYINSPAHYQQDDGKETWERMVDKWGLEATALWCEMTAFKYKDRMGKKPGEDVEREMGKIEWYENKAKELNEKANQSKFKWS